MQQVWIFGHKIVMMCGMKTIFTILLTLLFSLNSNFSAAADKKEPQVTGTVKWGKKIGDAQKKIPPGAVLYIFARRSEGLKGPPMAVKRVVAPFQLPLEFKLSATDSMMPGEKFEGPMNITARIAMSGAVMPVQPGDIEGMTAKPVKVGTNGIEVELNTVK